VFAWGAVMGSVNLMMHGAGWMEGGLHAGFEKMILTPSCSDGRGRSSTARSTRAGPISAIEVGPGGHFSRSTPGALSTAFHKPMLWTGGTTIVGGGGGPQLLARRTRCSSLLAAYVRRRGPGDPRESRLVARRKAEGGVPTDY
jgi:trimethylamine--corrinoid protein Co-methyltransferase